jgi:hypothetical protein
MEDVLRVVEVTVRVIVKEHVKRAVKENVTGVKADVKVLAPAPVSMDVKVEIITINNISWKKKKKKKKLPQGGSSSQTR